MENLDFTNVYPDEIIRINKSNEIDFIKLNDKEHHVFISGSQKDVPVFSDKHNFLITEGSYIFVNVQNKNLDENNFFGKIIKDNENNLLIDGMPLDALPKKWITKIR